MVNKYKRKTNQASWDEVTMASALKEITDLKRPVKATAQKFGIPLTTLHRHLKSGSAQKKLGRFVTIFTSEQENELLKYLHCMDALLKKKFLKLVYQYAEMNKISHPFKNDTAGKDWFKGFVKRHPELTLRKLQPSSIARSRAFNKLLEDQIKKYGVDATRLYNMDETEIQTCSNKRPENSKKSLVPDLIDTQHSPLMVRPLPTVAPNKISKRKIKTQINIDQHVHYKERKKRLDKRKQLM